MPGLSFINKLKPVTYHLDMNQIDAFMNPDKDKYPVRETAKEEALAKETGYNAKGSILETGFLAQDVENAAKELGYDFSGVDVPKMKKTCMDYAMRNSWYRWLKQYKNFLSRMML